METIVFKRDELKWWEFEIYKRLGFDHILYKNFIILFRGEKMIEPNENVGIRLKQALDDLVLFLFENEIREAYNYIDEKGLVLQGSDKYEKRKYWVYSVYAPELEQILKEKFNFSLRRFDKNKEYFYEISEGKIIIFVRGD
jgi:predicted AlkP superfamily pyrophosphatase or phosphodiesterase